MSVDRDLLLVVDGHAYAYRAFFAIRNLRSATGAPTNAIFGFVKALARLRAWLAPSHAAVVWDGGLDADRVAALPDYKAARPPMPPELAAQITALQSWLPLAGVASVLRAGAEADDLIAGLALRGRAAGCGVVVASSDKDFLPLVAAGVGLVNPGDKVERIWGAAEVEGKLGVRPEQVVDYLSLVGDAVDGIPGVPGVGAKTAAALLSRFGSVDGIYGRLAEVESARIRGALASSAEVVRRNQGLIGLRGAGQELPGLEELRWGAERWGELQECYAGWGFRGLAAEAADRLKPGHQTDGAERRKRGEGTGDGWTQAGLL